MASFNVRPKVTSAINVGEIVGASAKPKAEGQRLPVGEAYAVKSPEGVLPAVTITSSWKIEKKLDDDLKAKLAALKKRLQAAESARATFASQETVQTSTVRVEIHAASEAEMLAHWQYVRDEKATLTPELQSFYEVDARRLMTRFLAFPKRHRVLVVTSHDPGSGEQLVHFVFDTDQPQHFSLRADASLATPESVSLLNYIQPWVDPKTYQPSERYGYLVNVGRE